MIHRYASALALGTTLALSGAALADQKPASPSTPTQKAGKKSKDKHAHSDNHQKPPAPKK